MHKLLLRWLTADAKWHQFWMPKSGLPGGILAALVFLICFSFFVR